MSSKLAINGGQKVRESLFPPYEVLSEKEALIAADVVRSGVLSKFLGCWDEDFYGGPQVQAFEKEWAEAIGAKHAISVNSNTSGLFCALAAAEVGPCDEVIVSPYSMSISASAPLFFGAAPVFADIEEDTFCLDPKSVEAAITPQTKAIIAVDIFGHPYNAEKINALAKKHNIKVIEDCAQAPLATLNGKQAGTLGDMGVFSLNYHKHIHTGEGGVIVTNDDDLALRCQLVRNHAEAVVDDMPFKTSPINMIGLNFRLPEIEAGIGRSLLEKLPNLVKERQDNVAYLESKLKNIPFLKLPVVADGATHSYYTHSILFDETKANGLSRNRYVDAVKAELPPCKLRETEGVLIFSGYTKPLYWQSIYQNLTGLGAKQYPFNNPELKRKPNYQKGLCPIVEKLHLKTLFFHELMRPGMTHADLDDVAQAFIKVAESIHEL
jgi:dTDP-4-amino-4,6-dideoxygalactose transaminase